MLEEVNFPRSVQIVTTTAILKSKRILRKGLLIQGNILPLHQVTDNKKYVLTLKNRRELKVVSKTTAKTSDDPSKN